MSHALVGAAAALSARAGRRALFPTFAALPLLARRGHASLPTHSARVVELLDKNKKYAQSKPPAYFRALAETQTPKYLYLGCIDSRVSPELFFKLEPGDSFVHRNVGNQIRTNDPSGLGIVQFAVDSFGVSDIILAGHTSCGAIYNSLRGNKDSIKGHLRKAIIPLIQLKGMYRQQLEQYDNPDFRAMFLMNVNVIKSALTVSQLPCVQNAWAKGTPLTINGIYYDIGTGLVQDVVRFTADENEKILRPKLESLYLADEDVDGSDFLREDPAWIWSFMDWQDKTKGRIVMKGL